MLKRTEAIRSLPFPCFGPHATSYDALGSESFAKRLIRSFQNVLELSAKDISCPLPICNGHAHLYRDADHPGQLNVKPIAPLPILGKTEELATRQ